MKVSNKKQDEICGLVFKHTTGVRLKMWQTDKNKGRVETLEEIDRHMADMELKLAEELLKLFEPKKPTKDESNPNQ